MESPRKRQREEPATLEDLLNKARILMHKDPFKERAPQTEITHFRALFGCAPWIALTAWNLLVEHNLLPDNGTMYHFLWALIYLKAYPTELNLKKLIGQDTKTIQKYVDPMLEAIASLEPFIVSCCCKLPCCCCPPTVFHASNYVSTLFLLRSSGRIDSWVTNKMNALFLLMELIFKYATRADASVATSSTRSLVFDMRLRFAF